MKPAPPRSRVSGLRAHNFGAVLFLDQAEVKYRESKFLLRLVLGAAASLLWVAPQATAASSETLNNVRDWMDAHHCRLRSIVADMAFSSPVFMTFYAYYGIQYLATGPRTPWPNRAESAVRLFKQQLRVMSE